MSEQSPLVEFYGVAKRFCRDHQRSIRYGLRDIARDLLGLSGEVKRLRRDEFWALNEVSFTASRGEILGLVGRNGSGKSTILKMIAGIYGPDRGHIVTVGRVGSLIELGAGFHPMLTGRENIWVNAAILGLSHSEIADRIDSIIAFSGLSAGLLDAPLRVYSSGMHARLGFSVAIHTDPDILLVDEVLAVGDEEFRVQCHKKLHELRANTLVLLVSHNDRVMMELCDRAVWMEDGRLLSEGSISDILAHRYAGMGDEGAGGS